MKGEEERKLKRKRREVKRGEERKGRREERGERGGGYLILKVSNSTMLNTYKNFPAILVFVSGYSEERNEK